MSTDRPTRNSMSIEEATVSNMWEIAAIVEVWERKGLCTKPDLFDIITESRRLLPVKTRSMWTPCYRIMVIGRGVSHVNYTRPCVPDTPAFSPRGFTASIQQRNGRGWAQGAPPCDPIATSRCYSG
jgi:hypothetical protein